jgi:hypothetical protein
VIGKPAFTHVADQLRAAKIGKPAFTHVADQLRAAKPTALPLPLCYGTK